MTISNSGYLERVLKIYETQFNVDKKQQNASSKNSKREDEVFLSIEGKRKQLFEEMVLEILNQLSTNIFENEAK
ncbi:MAG: hypothetical protein LWW95_08625 [Candidatus Desulfofervidus auxilii]|nr:hypothetical protein [Candidatus Desulfofervidus auxilii]